MVFVFPQEEREEEREREEEIFDFLIQLATQTKKRRDAFFETSLLKISSVCLSSLPVKKTTKLTRARASSQKIFFHLSEKAKRERR